MRIVEIRLRDEFEKGPYYHEFKQFEMELAGRTLRVDVGQSGKTGQWRSIDALW